MPYTPPSHRSPASSATPSPDISRRSSFNGVGTSTGAAPRPALPRSASYLTKHRRTPSASGKPPQSLANGSELDSALDITPPGTSDDLKGMVAYDKSAPIRQSPPPVTDTRSMPPGAIISPPESQSSSEDEGAAGENRGRQIANLKELQDAISVISQHRESSPNGTSSDHLVLTERVGDLVEVAQNGKMPRRISGHSRSLTEPSIFTSKSADASLTASEEDSEQEDISQKPQMVRKKSGELVRPALRPAASRRSSSMPGTPTFSKAVHFDSHLEHVRHFLQVDRPLAVSAGSSPVDIYDSDTEYPFHTEDKAASRTPPFEWEIVINNFPAETPWRKSLSVRVERVWMSPDQKSLIGSIAIANLAFQKYVVCRFTFDYWKTTSEVTAEYCHEIRPRESDTGHDRFQFTIKLSDLANLESKTLFFCIRYNVNGQEYWDNNNNVNFQVDFKKKMLPQNGKKNFQGASSRPVNALPRSNRRTSPSSAARPKSMPMGFADDFGRDSKFPSHSQDIHEFLGESAPAGIRLKSLKSTTSLPSDNLANKLGSPSGQAFANRYDFGASLKTAMQGKKASSPNAGTGVLYMKPKASFGPPIQTQITPAVAWEPVSGPTASTSGVSAPAPVPGTDSPSSAIASASYEEMISKYCFFNGSRQTSPQIKDGTLQSGRYDGPSDHLYTTSSTTGSPDMANRTRDRVQRYAVNQNLNPYFQNSHMAIGASPAESPLNGPSPLSRQSVSPPSPSSRPSAGPIMTRVYTSNAGTSTSGFALDSSPFKHVQQLSDRFPFTPENHSATAIRG